MLLAVDEMRTLISTFIYYGTENLGRPFCSEFHETFEVVSANWKYEIRKDGACCLHRELLE